MFNLTKNSKIYIVAPPNYASGGPELLHQLCAKLCARGFNATMYYREHLKKHQVYNEPVPERFVHYGTTYVNEIEDSADNLLIVPEAITRPLKECKNIQKCEWWLGANNFFWAKEVNSHNKYLVSIYSWLLFLFRYPTPLTFGEIKKQNAVHLAQCWYAVGYLHHKGLHNVAYLSDYLGEDFLADHIRSHASGEKKKRRNIILYNPKRNIKFIKLLKHAMPSLEFVAIKNMTSTEVMEMMNIAKIYADFGAHPGKDRMPREAAMCGCCILTSTLGSADFFDDVPIPTEFKFERNRRNIPKVLDKIEDIFANYEVEAEKFEFYRDFILKEQEIFNKDVDKLFSIKNK